MKTSFSTLMTRAAATLACAVLLCACGGGNQQAAAASSPTAQSNDLTAKIQALEKSGAIPALDRSSSIAGPDANNNGVRDDIEAYIATLPITPTQKAGAMQAARAQQHKLAVDLADATALDRVSELGSRSIKCVADSFMPKRQDGYDLIKKIEAITANTRERSQQYIAYNRARSGSVSRGPTGNTCDP